MDISPEENIEDITTESQRLEEEIFLTQIRQFYEESFEKNSELFDYIAEQTKNFRKIGKEIIREEPNVVKVFRYLVKPPISQMKFGQFAGVNSTDSYEYENPTTPQKETAEKLANFVDSNIDKRKVPWIEDDSLEEDYEVEQSREWVCDIIAQSEAKTRYRNWRKDKQEDNVAESIVEAGLKSTSITSTLTSIDDLESGSFTSETKVRVSGGDNQKADFIARKNNGKLVFAEAKAIGVKIDSYKRIKEIRNKASDWRGTYSDSTVGAILAGWIPESQIETLLNDDIKVFWEHRLETLTDFLS